MGFDITRGDVVTVQDLTFDSNQGQAPLAVSEQILNDAESSPMLVKYAALLVGLFVVVAFAVRPAIRRAGAALAVRSPQKAASRELSPPLRPRHWARPSRRRWIPSGCAIRRSSSR